LPAELVEELSAEAKRAGLPLAAYLAFLSRTSSRQHDADFVGALKYAFTKYPNAVTVHAL
jgi:hypothetical protein